LDAPDHIIERAARAKQYELGLEELEMALYDEVKESMTYSNFPDNLRLKQFKTERDKSVIDGVYKRVEQIREYIKTI